MKTLRPAAPRPQASSRMAPAGAVAVISRQAVAHNVDCLRRRLDQDGRRSGPRLWAVVKADAYGHTLAHVLGGLGRADGLAVLELEEAHLCRAMGWRKPILVMHARYTAADLADPGLAPLHVIVDCEDQLRELEGLARRPGPHAWLRYRGCLNHSGFSAQAFRRAYDRLHELLQAGRLSGLGLLQHYARAEEAECLREERRDFETVFAGLPGPRCTENSAALLSDPGYAGSGDWVRSGIALYGISPLAGVDGGGLGLLPAMTLDAPIYDVQPLAAGDPLGYGATFRAAHALRVGMVHCGYADGYPRNLVAAGAVLVDGRPCRIIGRISMDSITIDLSDHPQAGPGTRALLWGHADLSIESVALSAGTIPAQLCVGVTGRVPRVAETI
jgi:alanine racemase